MCGCEDYDGPSVYHARMRRARVPRRCDECGATISPGELYVAISGCWEAEWQSFSDCRKCDALRQAWHDTEGCWPSHGNLRDDVLGCLTDIRRWPPSEREDEDEIADREADPVALAFGVNYRRRLGRMGPRRAA